MLNSMEDKNPDLEIYTKGDQASYVETLWDTVFDYPIPSEREDVIETGKLVIVYLEENKSKKYAHVMASRLKKSVNDRSQDDGKDAVMAPEHKLGKHIIFI